MNRPPPRKTLFPHTTLFRSLKVFNKIDRLAPEDQAQLVLSGEGVGVSALDAGTLAPLLARAQEILKGALVAMGEASPAVDRKKRKGGEGSV